MIARINSFLGEFVADGIGFNPLVRLNEPKAPRRFHHHNTA